jgi:hypothetical protein
MIFPHYPRSGVVHAPLGACLLGIGVNYLISIRQDPSPTHSSLEPTALQIGDREWSCGPWRLIVPGRVLVVRKGETRPLIYSRALLAFGGV